MQYEIITPAELGAPEIALWHGWQEQNPAIQSPYLCPEVYIVKQRHASGQRLAVLRDGGEIAGFLPFQQKANGVAQVRMLVCAPDFSWDTKELMAACGQSVFEFDYLVDPQLAAFQPYSYEREAAPVADLSEGWQSWLKRKSAESSQFKNLVRKQRKLDRELGPVHFELQSASHADLDQLMAWKSRQLILTGRVDQFADHNYRNYFHKLLDYSTEHFSIHLSRLTAADRTVGLHLTATTPSIAAVWHTAYDPDPELDKYSCGMGLMLSHMEAASAKGIIKIEYGKGFARYKEMFKDYEEHVVQGWSERPTALALARRVRQAPKRLAYRVVLGNPRLRVAARHTLARLGELRARLGGTQP